MTYKQILGLALVGQSASLLGDNYKNLKKKKPSLIKQGVKNIVGISLIKTQADIIGGFK